MPKKDVVRRVNTPLSGSSGAGGSGVITVPITASNADTVDNLHASAFPSPGRLLPLDSTGKWPMESLPLAEVSGFDTTNGLAIADSIAGAGLNITDKVLSVDVGAGLLISLTGAVEANIGGGLTIGGSGEIEVDLSANFAWNGLHTFYAGLESADILPSQPDTFDLGSSTRMWRKAWISEIEAVIFAENVASLVGGWLIVPHGQGTLPADVSPGATQIDFGQAMTPGDFVVFRSSAPAVEYMQVGTQVSGTVYNVTRDLDGSGANSWPAGTVYLVLGQAGDGRIELNAQDSPRIQILQQGAAYNDQLEVVRIGDLNGSFGITSETYGVGIGDYASGNYLRYEPGTGLVLLGGGGSVEIDEDGIKIGKDQYPVLETDKLRFGDFVTMYGWGGVPEYGSMAVWDLAAPNYALTIGMSLSPFNERAIVLSLGGAEAPNLQLTDWMGAIFGNVGVGIDTGEGYVPPGQLWAAGDARIGGGLVVGTVNSDPNPGDVVVSNDVYPLGVGRGVGARVTGTTLVTSHFANALPNGWQWAAASGQFNGVPSYLNYIYSDYLRLIANGGGQQHFLYKSLPNDPAYWQNKAIYVRCRAGNGTKVGVRWDNGNNAVDQPYAFAFLDGSAGNGTATLKFEFRNTVGGAVTTRSYATYPVNEFVTFSLRCVYISGTYAFYLYPQDEGGQPINMLNGDTGTVTWCPCAGRVGIVVRDSGNPVVFDWVRVDM